MKASLIASNEDTQHRGLTDIQRGLFAELSGPWSSHEQVAVSEAASEVAAGDEQLHANAWMRTRAGQLVSPIVARGRIERCEVPAARALVRHVRPTQGGASG